MSNAMNAGAVAPPAVATPESSRWLDVSAITYFADAAAIEPRQLPEPYHSLLVHRGSMTERLERQFGQPLAIEVLDASSADGRYARWVRMFDPARRCIAMAGVSVAIDAFGDDVRAAVLEGLQPLGRLLTRHGVIYESVPSAFMTFMPTAGTRDLLQMTETRRIYGRSTELRVSAGMPGAGMPGADTIGGGTLGALKLGDIIEALPRYDVQHLLGQR